jgi:hypothetical protein
MGFLVIVYTGSEASMPKVFIENVEEKLTKRCKQEEGQTIQWPKEKGQKNKQQSTKHYT